MNLLELFSGTGSVGKIARDLGFNVISLDLKNADINCDILEWDYKQFDRNHFSFIWSSPPCAEYSIAKTTGIRNIEHANSIVLKTLEIIDYFRFPYFVIENPQTGLLKSQSMTLTIANMDLFTGSELGCGTTLIDGNPEVYVIKIVVKLLIIHILKLRNGHQVESGKIGARIM